MKGMGPLFPKADAQGDGTGAKRCGDAGGGVRRVQVMGAGLVARLRQGPRPEVARRLDLPLRTLEGGSLGCQVLEWP